MFKQTISKTHDILKTTKFHQKLSLVEKVFDFFCEALYRMYRFISINYIVYKYLITHMTVGNSLSKTSVKKHMAIKKTLPAIIDDREHGNETCC